MVIRLLPSQIPLIWDTVKWCAVNADGVKPDITEPYLVNLLAGIMSDKLQCFARINDNREIKGIMITSINADIYTGEKTLNIEQLYSFSPVDNNQWVQEMDLLKMFCQKEQIKKITFNSNNPRIWQLADNLGFSEIQRHFMMPL